VKERGRVRLSGAAISEGFGESRSGEGDRVGAAIREERGKRKEERERQAKRSKETKESKEESKS
jgi:hypothetical protein